MNKAKALFTAGIIVIVAGASALCWYLNDSGALSEQAQNQEDADKYIVSVDYDDADNYNSIDNNDDDNDDDNDDAQSSDGSETSTLNEKDEKDNDDKEDENNQADDDRAVDSVDTVKINEYLTIFSSLYFSESSRYSSSDADTYELLKFAYLYSVVYKNGSGIVLRQIDDDIGTYSGIEASVAENIINRFFGLGIARESVYKEQTYAFFMYRDGYFLTPAADGMGYGNVSIVDYAEQSGSIISVKFTIYSDGVTSDMTAQQAKSCGNVYSSGSAILRQYGDSYRLESYYINE